MRRLVLTASLLVSATAAAEPAEPPPLSTDAPTAPPGVAPQPAPPATVSPPASPAAGQATGCPACPGCLPCPSPWPAPPPPAAAPVATAAVQVAQHPPAQFRSGFAVGLGLGAGLVHDSVQNGSAAGPSFGARFGYAFGTGRFALMGEIAGIVTGLENGGSYDVGGLSILGQYFLTDTWSVLAGLGGDSVTIKRQNTTLREADASGLVLGVGHDFWHFGGGRSLGLEARLAAFSTTDKPVDNQPGQKGKATILSLGGVYQWW